MVTGGCCCPSPALEPFANAGDFSAQEAGNSPASEVVTAVHDGPHGPIAPAQPRARRSRSIAWASRQGSSTWPQPTRIVKLPAIVLSMSRSMSAQRSPGPLVAQPPVELDDETRLDVLHVAICRGASDTDTTLAGSCRQPMRALDTDEEVALQHRVGAGRHVVEDRQQQSAMS